LITGPVADAFCSGTATSLRFRKSKTIWVSSF
jgi:hypothetical protein